MVTLPFDPTLADKVFQEVSDIKCWVPYWRAPISDKPGKFDKVPHNGRHGLSTADPNDWRTLSDALSTAKEWLDLAGVGLVMTDGIEVDGRCLVGLDFDNVDFDHFVLPFKSYAETSPSGKGIRSFVWVPADRIVKYQDTGEAHPPHCDHCEIYVGTSARFLTVTFQAINEEPIALIEGDNLKWLEEYLLPADSPAPPMEEPKWGEGKPINPARYDLTPDQKHLIDGTGDIDRSAVWHGLFIKLIDNGVSREDILATIAATPALLSALMAHRREDESLAMEFAKEEIERAYGKSKKAKRDKYVAFNKAWKDDKPLEVESDTELQWLLDHAPATTRSYIGWYMASAIRPHPVFALASWLVFMQALFGRNVIGPRNNRMNLWLILFAPTESGKGDIFDLANAAVRQIGKTKSANHVPLNPNIPSFERAFGSAESMWWLLSERPQIIWADTEFGRTLAKLDTAHEGTHAFNIKTTLLDLYDAPEKAHVPPINYSGRNKSNEKMPALKHPFFVPVGTGVLGDMGKLSVAASEGGLLNRFCVMVLDELPESGALDDPAPLPDALLEWAGTGCAFQVLTRFFLLDQPVTLTAYDGLKADWKAELDYGVKLAQTLPGVWGRYAQKILKVAMMYAMACNEGITKAGFEWSTRFMRWTLTRFAQRFEAEGGGAANEMDKLAKAFMHTFTVKSLAGKDILPIKVFHQYGGTAWRKCADSSMKMRVINSLIMDGLIEEVTEKGGYRKLG